MQKSCWYCHKPLSLFKSFKGDLFCDPEHEKLYLSDQFKRVQDPFASKATPAKAEPKPAPEPVTNTAPVAEPVTEPVTEPTPIESAAIEPPLVEAEVAAVEQAEVLETAAAGELSKLPDEPPVAPLLPWPVTAREGTHREPVLEAPVDLVPRRIVPLVASAPAPFEPIVEPIIVEPIIVEPIEVPDDPPMAPLVAWPISAREGLRRELVLESSMALVPQRIAPLARPEATGLQNTLAFSSSVAMPFATVEGIRLQPRPEERIDVVPDAVRPRMAEGSHLSTASEDFPIASLVATPMSPSEAPFSQGVPEEAIDARPDRISPSRRVPATPALSYGTPSPLRLGLRRSAVDRGAVSEPNWPAELEKHVPRMLSLGAVPQPELTSALSDPLNPTSRSGLEQGIPAGDAISSQVSPRIPQLASLHLDLTPASLSQLNHTPSRGTPHGTGQGLPIRGAVAFQPSPRIPLFALLKAEGGLNWQAATPTPYVPERVDQKLPERSSLESLLETSMQFSLASVVTLGRTSEVRGTTALGNAEFVPADCGSPSECPAASPVPGDALVTGTAARLPGSVRGLTWLRPPQVNSFGAITGMSTRDDSAVTPVQHVSEPVEGTRFSQVRSTPTVDGRHVQLVNGEHIGLFWSEQNSTSGPLPAIKSPTISAAALLFPQVQAGTTSVVAATALVPQHSLVDALQISPLSASVQTVQSLDSRLPAGRHYHTYPRLQSGVAQLTIARKDGPAQAFKDLPPLRALAAIGLPDASVLLDMPALGGGSTVSLAGAYAANGDVPEFSAEPTARRAVPASFLGLPGAVRRNVLISPTSADALEISIALANEEPARDVEETAHVIVAATTRLATRFFQLASPGLREHSVILNFAPITGCIPVGASLAQAGPRRHSPSSLVARPRIEAPEDQRFAALQDDPAVAV